MRPPKESRIEEAVCRDALRWGVDNVKIRKTGYPDRLFLVPGRPLWIEFKLPGEAPETHQEHIHETLRCLGYRVEVHDTYLGALRAIAAALEAAPRPKARHEVSAGARGRDTGG